MGQLGLLCSIWAPSRLLMRLMGKSKLDRPRLALERRMAAAEDAEGFLGENSRLRLSHHG